MPLGFSDRLELGLRLGTNGLRLHLPLGFSDRLELGLRLSIRARLSTREGLGLGLPLGFSDGLELGLRLCPTKQWPQLGADVWRDVEINVQTSDKCYIRSKNIREKRYLLFSIPIQSCSIVVPRAENADNLLTLLVAD